MGAISLENVHLLKVKLPLENDQRWLLLLYCFQNFPGEDPRTPFKIRKDVIYFSTQHSSTLAYSLMWGFKLGSKQQEQNSIDLW